MDEEERGRIVSRRAFLKNVGGGAVGAAIVSGGLLPAQRVDAQSPVVPETFQIGAKVGLFSDGIRYYMDKLLNETELSSAGALQVNLRLNESNTSSPSPVFIEWVGRSAVIKALNEKNALKGDPGRFRFGDALPSKVYLDALKAINNNAIPLTERNWLDRETLKEKSAGSQLLAPKAGAVYQKFIGIVALDKMNKKRRAGTITVGFAGKPSPSDLSKVEAKLKQWASWGNYKSDFCKYIESRLILGGPLA